MDKLFLVLLDSDVFGAVEDVNETVLGSQPHGRTLDGLILGLVFVDVVRLFIWSGLVFGLVAVLLLADEIDDVVIIVGRR